MKIQSIKSFNSFIQPNFLKKNIFRDNFQNNVLSKNLYPHSLDMVSFTSKQYGSDSIFNPTNHCAYCGSRVYDESQLDSIAKELLASKYARSEDKINSIIEKLSEAKHSQELSIAKRLENKKQIEFFGNYLEHVSKRPFLRGEDVFEQVYHLDPDSAYDCLMENLHPLLKTIDHVSPQREEKENSNSDVNLVEACYTCNHDIKRGLSFNEFYTMFPTIKNNMPKDKFKFAVSKILDFSQSQILQRFSASNMLKYLEVLFTQRTETSNALDSIDFKIKGCKSNISDSIESCKMEIAEKQQEKSDLEAKFAQLKQDPEYVAMLHRLDLSDNLASVDSSLEKLRARRSRINDSVSSLLGNTKKVSKKTEQMSDEEKENKISSLKNEEFSLSSQIKTLEDKKAFLELSIEEHDAEFPTIDILQTKKNRADAVINAHISLNKEQKLIEEKTDKKIELEAKEAELSSLLETLPESASVFNIDSYSPEEQAQYKNYKDLIEAKTYIDEHPNGGVVRVLIHSKAKNPILQEIQDMQQLPVIIDFMNYERKKSISSELEQVQKKKADIVSLIHQSEKNIKNFQHIAETMSMEEAKKKSDELSEHIRRLNEKQKNIKIRSLISSLSAEILLLEQTIIDLQTRQEKIESMYFQT